MTKPTRARKNLWLAISAVVAAGAVLSGCAGGTGGNLITGDHLTIYSSLPLTGYDKEISQQVLSGEKLALKQSGGKVGKLDIGFVSLNDADPKTGQWTPAVVSENARKVASDQSAVAYLGEAVAGSSVISVPIMNEAGILTVSPLDNYAGLTVSAGVEKGEPDKYYPSGDRTFGRVVPPSNLEAGVVVTAMIKKKIKSIQIVSDTSLYGRSLAKTVAQKAKQAHITVIDSGTDKQLGVTDPKGLPTELKQDRKGKNVDGVFLAGEFGENLMLIGTSEPKLKLFTAGDMTSARSLYEIRNAQPQTTIISSVEPISRYGAEGENFIKAYKKEFGSEPGPYAVYGYTAMGAVLESLKAAKDNANDRTKVIDEFFRLKNQPSPLGEYTIDANGDTSIENFYSYSVKNGKPVFEEKLESK